MEQLFDGIEMAGGGPSLSGHGRAEHTGSHVPGGRFGHHLRHLPGRGEAAELPTVARLADVVGLRRRNGPLPSYVPYPWAVCVCVG
jgi:hypothetical protein